MGMFDMTLEVADGTSRKENMLRKLDRIETWFETDLRREDRTLSRC